MDLLEVVDEFLFNVYMVFQALSFAILNEGNGVAHSSLDCGSVKELSIPFAFL